MSPVTSVKITARDGRSLEGFVTLPRGKSTNVPLIVVPHGGPIGLHDEPRFDSWVQFLAYKGFGVLQVNYRGSDGYGLEFLTAGFQQWGGKIQDDVVDATKWAIARGIADSHRIAIFGGSFGGYTALEATIRNPGLYRCAIGYAGVYNLSKLLSEKERYLRPFFKLTMGDDTRLLEQQSPALHADAIGIPVFLIHGTEDSTAPIAQFEEMSSAIQATGGVLWKMVKEGEEHGFYNPDNNAELFDAIDGFLNKYLASAPVPPVTDGQPATGAVPSQHGSETQSSDRSQRNYALPTGKP